jgi:hypothetical protein
MDPDDDREQDGDRRGTAAGHIPDHEAAHGCRGHDTGPTYLAVGAGTASPAGGVGG